MESTNSKKDSPKPIRPFIEQIIPEPDPLDLAMLMRWTKVKDKDGKIKRVYRIVKTKK